MDTGVTALECTSFFTALIWNHAGNIISGWRNQYLYYVEYTFLFTYRSILFVSYFHFTEQLKEMGFSERNRFYLTDGRNYLKKRGENTIREDFLKKWSPIKS